MRCKDLFRTPFPFIAGNDVADHREQRQWCFLAL
jgi:hypothetical protein